MFGYINVNTKELSEESRIIYQSFYCGLCKELHRLGGKKVQLLLNYDMTFLIVFLCALYEKEVSENSFTCLLHPTQRRKSYVNEITEYAAAMNVALGYHKLMDNWVDDKNLAMKTMAMSLEKDYKMVKERYPRQVKTIENYITTLREYEKAKENNIDVVAGITGEMLGELFVWKEDEWKEELHTFGFYLGKFIYLMDAYEDLDRDIKRHSYNPLIELKQNHPKDYETICKLMLTSMMSECAKTFERLPVLLYADIIRNILYSGVWSRYEYYQLKKRKRKDRQ